MAEIIEVKDSNLEKQALSPSNHDQFFDAEDEDAVSKELDNEDEDFLKKIDEAINAESETVSKFCEPPLKKICLEDKSDSELQSKSVDLDALLAEEEETLLKLDEEDQIKNDSELAIDSKSENELLKSIDDDNENDANGEFEDILNSVQNDDIKEVKNDEKDMIENKGDESKISELAKEEANENLLELCESPKDIEDDQLSNDVGSTDDTNESESNTESEKGINKENEEQKKNESNMEEEAADTEDQKNQKDESTPSAQNEDNENIEKTVSESSLEKMLVDDDMPPENDNETKTDTNVEEFKETSIEMDNGSSQNACEHVNKEKDETKTDDVRAEFKKDMSIESDNANSSDDINKNDDTKTENVSELKEETSIESDNGSSQNACEDVNKKEEIKIKLNFMRKFATSLEKLSRTDLEELLLEKITEAIVFRSECTELRTKCEKQDETIDNLKQRIQSITKQYNDLDMIHKRIMKDLRDRPDQPITPVKITRAVGLQVYQPQTNNNSNNLKPKVSSTPLVVKPTMNKRPSDSDLSDKEAEAKRKKSNKLITPMRPPLSDKEKASLEKQEANFEQKIRTKLIKSDIVISPAKTLSNGMNNKPQSTQSIDLTDEDDTPSNVVQQPPALVAIQKNNFVNPRGLVRNANPMVRPNILNRMDQSRMIPGMSRHPAPLPPIPPQPTLQGMKKIPPRPTIKINNVPNGIIVSWTVDTLTNEHAEIHSYQIYAYEETRTPPNSESWKHVGDVKALLLPMAVTLTQFQEGQKYHFAVRAVDVHRRIGQFSLPKTWPLPKISVHNALETITTKFSSSMKSILLTSKSPSNNHLVSSVGSHNHRKNDSNRNETEDVNLIENIEKEQYNKLINHSNNIKKQVIRSKIIAKNDDKLKRVSSDSNNDFLLSSTENHPLIHTNNAIINSNDNDNVQKTATKFINLHSKNGTTLIFQRKTCLQSKQQQHSSGTNVNEELKKESFKKRQSLQWPIGSAVDSNKFDYRNIRHHSWYDDSRYPNAIEEEFDKSPLTQFANDENNLADIKTIVASSIINISNNDENVPDNNIMKTSSIDNTSTASGTTTTSKRWRIEQFLKSLVGKRSSAAPSSTTNVVQKVSKSPSAYDLLPQKSSRCGSITSLNKDRLINKSTASLNSTSLAMVHQKLWSVVPLLNRKDGDGASCNNLLANLNGNNISSNSNRMRKCETVLALTDEQSIITSASSRRNHSKSINSLLEPMRPLNRLRNSQSCYVNCDNQNQSFTTKVRQTQTCSHCSSLLSLAAVGDSNYSLTNGAFVLKNNNSNGNRTKRNSATIQEDLLMTKSDVLVDDDDDCSSKHNLIENDFNSIEPYDAASVKLPLAKGQQPVTVLNSLNKASSTLSTKFTCKLCLGEFFHEDKLTTIASCGCTFCTECMRAYVEFEISEGAYELSCPDALCNTQGVVSLAEISQLATASLVAKHHRYRLNREVELDKFRLWCPNRNCETICSVIPMNEKPSTSSQSTIQQQQQPSSSTATLLLPRSVLCPTCNLEFCSSCKKTWHPSITCEENSKRLGSRNDSMMLFDNDLIKNCPMCAVPIEKDEGCAQMMCKRCKHVFCWYCLASLDDDFLLRHYDKGPCKNKLGHSRASVVWHRAQVIGIFAGFGILLLVASPLLLLAAPCIVCCKCKIEESTTVGKLDEPENHSDHQV